MAKTAAKKTTRKTAAPKKATKTTASAPEAKAPAQAAPTSKSCAYPSCSARGSQTFGDNNVPSCDIHAEIFETQANDGAGIEHLMANYKG